MRWTRQRRREVDIAGQVYPVSDTFTQDDGAIARLSLLAKTGVCVRQNRVVLAPVAGVKSAEVFAGPTGREKTFNPSMTVTRRIRRRGERGISRKAIARGMPECLRLYLYAHVRFFCTIWHMRPRVQRAPGIPCSLFCFEGQTVPAMLGQIMPRERAAVSVAAFSTVVARERGRSSTPRPHGSIAAVSGILDRPVKPGQAGRRRGERVCTDRHHVIARSS
jgi:hypothetical protein